MQEAKGVQFQPPQRVDLDDLEASTCAMQEAEGLLHQFGQSLATLEGSLMGLVKMEAPHQPLALSSLLQLLTSEQVSLATSNHPVIKVWPSHPSPDHGMLGPCKPHIACIWQ